MPRTTKHKESKVRRRERQQEKEQNGKDVNDQRKEENRNR